MAITAAHLMVKVGADTGDAERGLQSVNDRLNSFGKQAAITGGLLTAGVTLPLVGVAKQALSTAMDYQSALNLMQAVSGATDEEMRKVSETAKALGADMSLPATSAADAANAMVELAKAGLSVEQSIAAARGVLQLSAAGNLSNAAAAEIAANALNAFGLQGSEATRVANLLAAAANASSAEVTDVADSLKMASAVFASAGIPIEELVAAIGQMANAGIKGSDAGTSLKQMLLSLQAPSTKAKELMAELGIQIYDAQGKMLPFNEIIRQFSEALSDNAARVLKSGGASEKLAKAAARAAEQVSPLTERIRLQKEQLSILSQELAKVEEKYGAGSIQAQKKRLQIDKLNASIAENERDLAGLHRTLKEYESATGTSTAKVVQMTQEQRNAALATIFGSDAVRAANIVLMGGVDAHEQMHQAVTREGAAADLAGARMKGLAGALQGLQSQIETVLLEVAEPFLGTLEGWVRALADLIPKIGEIDPNIRNAALAFAAVLAAAGPAILAFGALSSAIGFLLSPIGLVVVAVAALAAAWATNFLGIRDLATQAMETIQAIITTVLTAVQTFWQEHGAQIVATAQWAWGVVSQFIDQAVANVEGIIRAVMLRVQGFWAENGAQIAEATQIVWNRIQEAVRTVANAVRSFWEEHGAQILQITQNVWQIIFENISIVLDLIFGVIKVVTALIRGDWKGAWEAIQETARAVWEGILNIAESALGALHTVITVGLDVIRPLWERVWGGVSDFVFGIWDGIVGHIRAAIDSIRAAINSLIDKWNALSFRVPGFNVNIPSVSIPGVGQVGGGTLSWPGINIATPQIPRLAEGGVVTRPTLALIGERGPEAVVPLSRAAARTYVVNIYNPPTATTEAQLLRSLRRVELLYG